MKSRSHLLFRENIPYDKGEALVYPSSGMERGFMHNDRYSTSYLDRWSARKYLNPFFHKHRQVRANGYVEFSMQNLLIFNYSGDWPNLYNGDIESKDKPIRINSLWYTRYPKTGVEASSFTLFPDFRSTSGCVTYVLARLHQDTIQVEVRKSNNEKAINLDFFLHFAPDLLDPARMIALACTPPKIVCLNKR